MTWWAEPATVEGARKIDSDVTVLTSETPPDMLDITASDYAYYETSVQLPDSEKDEWWLRVFLPPSSGVTVFADGVATGVQNNGEQALFTETALAVPLPRSNKSTTRSIVLLAASFGTNDDEPTPRPGDPRNQRQGVAGAQLLNVASSPGLGPCKVEHRTGRDRRR